MNARSPLVILLSLSLSAGADAYGAAVPSFGAGCPGTVGAAPELSGTGVTAPGGWLRLDVRQGPPSVPGLLFLGTDEAELAAGFGCSLLVTPVLATSPIALDPAGELSITADLPASFPSVAFTVQAFVADPVVSHGFAATNGLAISIECPAPCAEPSFYSPFLVGIYDGSTFLQSGVLIHGSWLLTTAGTAVESAPIENLVVRSGSPTLGGGAATTVKSRATMWNGSAPSYLLIRLSEAAPYPAQSIGMSTECSFPGEAVVVTGWLGDGIEVLDASAQITDTSAPVYTAVADCGFGPSAEAAAVLDSTRQRLVGLVLPANGCASQEILKVCHIRDHVIDVIYGPF